jgi:hypothetical protein
MFDIAASLRPALSEAQRQLGEASAAVARANAGGAGATDRAMAQTAQAALFQQALLSAMHARIAEVKAVTKQ